MFMEAWTEKTNVDGIAGLEFHVISSTEMGVRLSLRAGQGVVVYDIRGRPPFGTHLPMDEPAGTVNGRRCPDVFMEAMAPKLPHVVKLFKAAVRYRKANTPEMITGLINATKALADI